MDVVRAFIRRFDGWLSRIEGVEPFTDDPRCIMRIQVSRAKHDLILPDRVIPRGADVLLLHAWNERMPRIPSDGPDLAYAVRYRQRSIASLKLIARHIASTPSLQEVQAVGGVTAHISLEHARGGRAMLEHLGFTLMPYHRPFGAFGEFWENFYTWWLMWTFNPASTRHRKLWRLQRTEFWMAKDRFLEKYGGYSAAWF
jgi:hypothetical protein